MRACLVDRTGVERWEDDDLETPAERIHIVESKGVVRHYAYVGDFKTQNHSYRRYQEIVTETVQ